MTHHADDRELAATLDPTSISADEKNTDRAGAVLDGRFAAEADDVRALAHPVLRHRIVASFRAEAEGVRATDVIDAILEAVQP